METKELLEKAIQINEKLVAKLKELEKRRRTYWVQMERVFYL